jgi:hypothetical protein
MTSAVLSGGEQMSTQRRWRDKSIITGSVVEDGGVGNGTHVLSGGAIELEGTGSAIDTMLDDGATEIVCDSAFAANIDVASGVTVSVL